MRPHAGQFQGGLFAYAVGCTGDQNGFVLHANCSFLLVARLPYKLYGRSKAGESRRLSPADLRQTAHLACIHSRTRDGVLVLSFSRFISSWSVYLLKR
jgi:hypothetical protein